MQQFDSDPQIGKVKCWWITLILMKPEAAPEGVDPLLRRLLRKR